MLNRFADKGIDFITLDDGICNKCKYKNMGEETCTAFPDGIPEEVLRGEFIHILPYEGDNGITFEPRVGIVG